MNLVILQENCLRFRLNIKDSTASVISSPDAVGEVFVPNFIEYHDIKYNVKSIEQHAFSGDKIKFISFDKNSMVKVFKSESFYKLSIDMLYIPASLEKIEPGCFFKIQKPFKIKVSSRNKHFSYIENSFLVERNEDGFYTLIYANCDLEKAVIPSTIKEIRPSSLSNNTKLKSLVFNEDSIIESIKYGVIVESLEEIVIPKSLTNINQECFQLAINLANINILDGNEKYKYKDPFLLKIDDESHEFNEIVFCRNNIEKVSIPIHIKKIASYAFSNCNEINEIKFFSNSKLETIDSYAFYSIPGPSIILLPKLVNYVGEFAFYRMKNLEKVGFYSENIRISSKCFFLCDKLKSIHFRVAKKLYLEDSIPETTKIIVLPKIELSCKLIDQYKKRIVNLKTSEESQSEISDSNSHLDQLKEEYENKIDELKKEYEKKIKKLEKEYKKIIMEFKDSCQQKEQKNSEQSANENIIRELEEENNNLKQEVETQKQDIIMLEKKYSYLENNLREYQNIKVIDYKMIENYKKIKEIGSSSNSIVYEVSNDKIYALKTMITRILKNKYEQFNNENKNLQIHPNILKIFGIFLGDKNNPSSILSELCQTNLDEAIKKQSFTNSELVFIIYQIAEGMKFIHYSKVIHQNLTSTNILISSDNIIKISDTGISKLISNKNYIPSLKFAAPEILNGLDFDEKADVYSFGVILYYIISKGNMPNIEPRDVAKGKMADIPPEFTKISSRLIRQCWNFEPKDRPSFEIIVSEIEKNIKTFLKLDKKGFDEVKSMIENYKVMIPFYSTTK